MEINLGDLGISPAMMRKFQENYAKGIAAPKKAKKAAGKKKTVAKKTKPAVGRRRGQPVGGRGIDLKVPKKTGYKRGRGTIADIELPELVRSGVLVAREQKPLVL